jgi:putative RNA 2'-phosphotransferase
MRAPETALDVARRIKVSKYLSKHLRHEPERLGLTLAPGGWVNVDDLLAACSRNGFAISRADLEEVVATNDKQRFSFDPDGACIRANQGHSTTVDLLLEPLSPPDVLYHGTTENSVPEILASGLFKMARHHVHLSSDLATARKVGARHGRPVVLVVNATSMARDGHVFFCSANGVWLVDSVPPQYLRPIA